MEGNIDWKSFQDLSTWNFFVFVKKKLDKNFFVDFLLLMKRTTLYGLLD